MCFGKAFLGLTVACARCHDHKFDAISTADYYALSAYLQSSCRQKTLIDAGRKFETTTQQIDQFRQQAAMQLAKIDSEVEKRLRPGTYYEVATELLERASEQNDASHVLPKWIEEAASKHGLESPRLQRWVDNANDLVDSIRSTQLDPKNQSSLFADFDSGSLPDGWSTSGLAFHTIGSETSISVDGHMPHAGSIDSGLAGKKQVGILRSPTFEITTNQIHVRMKASANITIRVIIDNYQMAVFSGLLFKGTFLNGKQTDTEGKWAWKSLGGDLKKYKGHKAYLEFVDDSDATIAIDEIRFSDGPPPKHATRKRHSQQAGAVLADELWQVGLRDLRQGRSNRFHQLDAQRGVAHGRRTEPRRSQVTCPGRNPCPAASRTSICGRDGTRHAGRCACLYPRQPYESGTNKSRRGSLRLSMASRFHVLNWPIVLPAPITR